MRFAISAVAAISGLFLFGLAFYGQPALYLHQAREEWYALMDRPTVDQPIDPERDAEAERVARLQQQVAQLENALAAHQNPPSQQPVTSEPMPPLPAPPAVLSQPGATHIEATQPGTWLEAGAPAIQPVLPQTSPPQSGSPQLAQLQPPPPQVAVAQPAPTPREPATPRLEAVAPKLQPETSRPVALPPEAPASRMTEPVPTAVAIPQHHDTLTAESKPQAQATTAQPTTAQPATAQPANPQSADPDASKPQSSKVEALKPEPSKPDPARAQKLASLKPTPVPPLPQPAPRQDTDDAQSVLARLRQQAPPVSAPPVQQVNAPPPIELKPRPVQSPSLPRLAAARAALAAGRVEDARRLLQEAQLQLVFRPISAAGDDLPSAGKGAANVAHALDALSANDIPLSRRYIDVAVDDLSGAGTNSPIQESQVRATGYAPAYPPR